MIRKFGLAMSIVALLGACGHKPLKAPCEPGDAQPLSSFFAAILPELFGALVPTAGECGPLRRF